MIKNKEVTTKEECRELKTDALAILERTLEFNRMYDQKASIFLTVLAAGTTLVFVNMGSSIIRQIFASAGICTDICVVWILRLSLILSVICTIFGFISLFKVIFPRTKEYNDCWAKHAESIFFNPIANRFSSAERYKDRLCEDHKNSGENFFKGILYEIIANSRICQKKNKAFKIGSICSITGLAASGLVLVIASVIL